MKTQRNKPSNENCQTKHESGKRIAILALVLAICFASFSSLERKHCVGETMSNTAIASTESTDEPPTSEVLTTTKIETTEPTTQPRKESTEEQTTKTQKEKPKEKTTKPKKENQEEKTSKPATPVQKAETTTIAPDEFEKMTLPGTDPNYVYVPPECSYGKWGKKGDIDVKSLEAKANAYAATYDCVVIDDTLDVKSSSWSFREAAHSYTNEQDLLENINACTAVDIELLQEANDFSHGEKIQFYMKIVLEYDETYNDYYYFCYPLYLI